MTISERLTEPMTSRERVTQAELTAKVRESMARYAAPETLNPPLSVAPDKGRRAVETLNLTRSGILATADELINGHRARDYGDAAESFGRLAALWAATLGVPITPAQVALCLLQLKVSRLCTSPGHVDSWIDAAGYIALGGEIATGAQS